MLEHQKLVLEKVSHDRLLFQKELQKSYKWLKLHELTKLHAWVKEKFNDKYDDIISEVFGVKFV